MIEPDNPLLASLKGLNASPIHMRTVLEELSQVLQADKSWSRAEIFRAGKILLNQKEASPVKDLWPSPPP